MHALQTKLLELNGACCAAAGGKSCAGWIDEPGFVCSGGCAAVLLPFFAQCHAAIDNVWDVFGNDRTLDGRARATHLPIHVLALLVSHSRVNCVPEHISSKKRS